MIETCWCGSDAIYEDGQLTCMGSKYHDPTYREPTEPTKLYVSGPMSNYPYNNYPAFNEAAERLREAGYEVRNPAEEGSPNSQYSDLIRKDVIAVSEVEGLAMLEGWWSSRGAQVEVHLAGVLGLPIRPVEEWIQRREES